ncbi:MAG: HAD-IA family hydrolase [Clostridia bacterium]|nr:HAD-IA family hydrolase [Clostridia bacterium]
MYETIVFDLDGTLLDTLDDLTASVNAALAQFSLPLRTKNEVRGFIGNGIAKLMERACGDAEYPQKDGLLTAFKTHYGAHCKDATRPYDGVLETLRMLQKRGVKTAVVSNKADFAVKILAKEYFGDLLLEAVGENEAAGIRKKPAPDSLLAVMKRLGSAKETTLYVGDSEVDIQTAENAGVDCLCVTWGFKERKFLLQNGAKKLADTPMEILKYIEE